MQITTYKCDECGDILSDDKTAIPHLSIRLGFPSGLTEKKEGRWKFTAELDRYTAVVHFCNLSHLMKWLAGKLDLLEPAPD